MGPPTRYQLGLRLLFALAGPANPLEASTESTDAHRARQQKRKLPVGRVHDEEGKAKRKRKVDLVEVFGVDELPPALQCVEFKAP